MNPRIITLLAILVLAGEIQADALPTVGLSYDLQEMGLVADPTHKGVLNQLKDVSFVRMIANDLDDVYVLKATFNSFYNGTSYGQATELMAMDTSTEQLLIPKNITTTGEHKCLPVVSGTTAKFTCVYRMANNKITETSKIHLFIYLPDSLVLFNTKALAPKDFIASTPTCQAPLVLSSDGKTCIPPETPVSMCKNPMPTLQINGSCGVGCNGANQEMDIGKAMCVCKSGFIVDPLSKTCAPDPSLNAQQPPAAGGGSCSVTPNASFPNFGGALILIPIAVALSRRFVRKLAAR